MKSKKLTATSRVMIWVLAILTFSLLVFRNHFILGTFLILSRWILLLFAAWFHVKTHRRNGRRIYLILTISICTLIFAEFVFNKLTQERLQPSTNGTELSIMTYNVFFRNKDPKAIEAIIRKNNPDILVLQEVTNEWKTRLEKSIGSNYPYKEIFTHQGTHGIAIYSKYKITNPLRLNNKAKLPYALLVDIDINKGRLRLINTHLASPAVAVENRDRFFELYHKNYSIRKQEIITINNLSLEHQDDYVAQILLGDLNTTKYEPLYRTIRNHWVDLTRLSGKGSASNFPNTKKYSPFLTLDYIFLKGNVGGIETKVIAGGSSDHLAIFGKIRI